MKYYIILFFLIFSTVLAQWETINPPNNEQIDRIISDENILYAGTILARVYQSTDHGESWTQIGEDIDEITYATDVLLKKDSYLFFSHNVGSSNYNFRCVFNGEEWGTWEPLPYQTSSFTQMQSNSDYLVTIISGGIAFSDDYGDTWILMSQPPLEGYLNIPFVDDNYIYVNHGCNIYRTNSMGEAWEDVTGVLDDIGPPEPYGCTSVLAMEMVGDKLIASIYWYGGVGRLFYSENYGDAWEWIDTFPSQSGSGMGDNNVNALAIVSDYLFAGTATSQDGLFYTNDFVNWTEYSGGLDTYSLSFASIISTNDFLFKTGGTVSVFRAPIPDEIELETTVEVQYSENWNLIGLPVIVEDSGYESIFEGAVSGTLYSFDSGYTLESELVSGMGYWIRLESDELVNFTGGTIQTLTIQLSEGWNLVSGISVSVPIENIVDPSGIIISGAIYQYSDGYSFAELFEPGKGYWIRAIISGSITLIGD